jgi:hypothetical protein
VQPGHPTRYWLNGRDGTHIVEQAGCTGVAERSALAAVRGPGGRYWVRTSDLLGVNEALYH